MDPYIKITKKFTKKFGSKVINIQYFLRKTGLNFLLLSFWISILPEWHIQFFLVTRIIFPTIVMIIVIFGVNFSYKFDTHDIFEGVCFIEFAFTFIGLAVTGAISHIHPLIATIVGSQDFTKQHYIESPPYMHFRTIKKSCYMKFVLVGLLTKKSKAEIVYKPSYES